MYTHMFSAVEKTREYNWKNYFTANQMKNTFTAICKIQCIHTCSLQYVSAIQMTF